MEIELGGIEGFPVFNDKIEALLGLAFGVLVVDDFVVEPGDIAFIELISDVMGCFFRKSQHSERVVGAVPVFKAAYVSTESCHGVAKRCRGVGNRRRGWVEFEPCVGPKHASAPAFHGDYR